jgi:hypothetical protein
MKTVKTPTGLISSYVFFALEKNPGRSSTVDREVRYSSFVSTWGTFMSRDGVTVDGFWIDGPFYCTL